MACWSKADENKYWEGHNPKSLKYSTPIDPKMIKAEKDLAAKVMPAYNPPE